MNSRRIFNHPHQGWIFSFAKITSLNPIPVGRFDGRYLDSWKFYPAIKPIKPQNSKKGTAIFSNFCLDTNMTFRWRTVTSSNVKMTGWNFLEIFQTKFLSNHCATRPLILSYSFSRWKSWDRQNFLQNIDKYFE